MKHIWMQMQGDLLNRGKEYYSWNIYLSEPRVTCMIEKVNEMDWSAEKITAPSSFSAKRSSVALMS